VRGVPHGGGKQPRRWSARPLGSRSSSSCTALTPVAAKTGTVKVRAAVANCKSSLAVAARYSYEQINPAGAAGTRG
jgi:hypothetical protein